METTRNQRLSQVIEYFINSKRVYNQADFSKKTNIRQTFLTDMKNGRRPVSDATIEEIVLHFPDLSRSWLLTGEGDMLVKKIEDEPLPAARKTASSRKGIPLIPLDAVAGFPAIDNDGVSFDDCERYSIPEFEAKGANFLIRVSGDSMTPMYNNGDIIACRKIAEIHFFQWGGVYVLDTSQGVLVKYVEECEKDGDSIVCVSENKRYKPFRLPKEDIRSLSTIVGLVRLV